MIIGYIESLELRKIISDTVTVNLHLPWPTDANEL